MAATHEEWQAAMEARDSRARRACRALLDGDAASALTLAQQFDAFDEAMDRLAKILDADSATYR